MLRPLVAVALAVAALAAAEAGAGTTTVDFGVTLTGPETAKSKVGAPTTYTVAVTNAGPATESAHLRLAGGKGATDVSTGEPIKTQSEAPSQGNCKNDGFGVTCRLGEIPPGATVTVEVVVVPQEKDSPVLDLQATVEPDKASVVDADAANDHVELDTEIPAPIKIEGIPNRCTSKKIVLRVRARVGSLAKQTKLEVDGDVLASTTKNRLKVAIKKGALKPGNHELVVIVQSSGPPLATFKGKFKTCEA